MGHRILCKCGWYRVSKLACLCEGNTCCEHTRILKERDAYFELVVAVFDNKPASYIQALACDLLSKFEGWFWMKHCAKEHGICESCLAKPQPAGTVLEAGPTGRVGPDGRGRIWRCKRCGKRTHKEGHTVGDCREISALAEGGKGGG